MIIDGHSHFCVELGIKTSKEQFIDAMDSYGISKSCVSSSEAINYCAERGNDAVLDFMEQYPNRIIGFCVPNPHRQPLREVKRCIKAGFRGIKLHPWCHDCPLSSPKYLAVFEEAASQEIPILFHSGGTLKISDFKYAPLEKILLLAQEFSTVNWIIGHMGLDRWQEAIDMVAPFKNLYLDITMSMPHPDRVERAVQKVGAHRVIFGTDMTLLDPAVPLGLIQGSKISKEEKGLVLGGNIMRLLQMNEKGIN